MDCKKTGTLILNLRKSKKMTQKNLADALNISDKTISKWERGLGCPDITLLKELSYLLEVNIESILIGTMNDNGVDGGNMKQTKFYVCPNCKNIIHSTGVSEIGCCGRRLEPLEAKLMDAEHDVNISEVEYDYFITYEHSMKKDHYVSFCAHVMPDRVLLIRLYPEQSPTVRFPKTGGGIFYFYCTEHGLFWRAL